MNKLIIANWKENPQTLTEAVSLAKAIDDENLVIAPPYPFLETVGKVIKKASLGAQDLFWEDGGAFTGGVSGSQLKDLGVKYVIVGHSERRRLGDTDEVVAKKVAAAIRNNIIPIICIGEKREERKAGQSKSVIEKQLKAALSLVKDQKSKVAMVIAYEPVWAISTEPGAEPDTPENAVSMIKFMKTLVPSSYSLVPRFIYGGSVNANNAEGFLREKEIEGALVGGASLKEQGIKEIIKIARQYGN